MPAMPAKPHATLFNGTTLRIYVEPTKLYAGDGVRELLTMAVEHVKQRKGPVEVIEYSETSPFDRALKDGRAP